MADPGMVDLHTHTFFSDGLFSPEELVAEARKRDLAAVGVTDHDTLGAIERALAAGRKHGVEIVPGVEMSCSIDGIDMHILGYYLDYRDKEVVKFFEEMQRHREERARKMVDLLVELGLGVSFEKVRLIAGDGAIGRPHVAQAMVEAGVVPDADQAFRRYIGYDKPAYVPKTRLSPQQSIEFIGRHAGVAVIAHPGTYRNDNAVYRAVIAGADGIEVWHSDHNDGAVARYDELARKNGLLMTGGSDCHGGRKGGRVFLGETRIPYRYLAAVKRLHRERKAE